ncbi:MAG: hypothetical protein ACYC54_08810 [Sedimentisphaerales bacterium]
MEDNKIIEKAAGPQCPQCGCRHLPVDHTSRQGKVIRRYRHCRNCSKHILTTERVGS